MWRCRRRRGWALGPRPRPKAPGLRSELVALAETGAGQTVPSNPFLRLLNVLEHRTSCLIKRETYFAFLTPVEIFPLLCPPPSPPPFLFFVFFLFSFFFFFFFFFFGL